VVLEAGWNWGSMYDWLERMENVVKVQLAHPFGFGDRGGAGQDGVTTRRAG
jgi:hypothetical protein